MFLPVLVQSGLDLYFVFLCYNFDCSFCLPFDGE